MTLGAPGGNAGLLVVDGNGSYNWAQGTRMAAPTPDLGKPGNDEMYGMGLVNAWRAVRSLARRAARALMS